MSKNWVSHEDQDQCICKRRYMGLWMLEAKENGWTSSDKPTFICTVFKWNNEDRSYKTVRISKKIIMGMQGAKAHLEAWYYENVMEAEVLLGKDPDSNS